MERPGTGQFVWHDHLTRDPDAAIAFYSEVIGWTTERFGDSHYIMWVGSQGPMGGVLKLPDEVAGSGVPPHWIGNVQVADVDATVALARKLGGQAHTEPADIPTVGRFAVIADPQGASVSVFQPSGEMELHDTSRPGEVCWNELLTSDAAAAFEFYSQLFGWKILNQMDMGPMGTYRVYGVGDKQLGGMMTAPQARPPTWMYYVETDDLDSALERARRKGGKVLNGPMDVPGGRIVALMDPQGAAFSLHQIAKR
jgi:predicted enzyme related to lactoylglutathione lyase